MLGKVPVRIVKCHQHGARGQAAALFPQLHQLRQPQDVVVVRQKVHLRVKRLRRDHDARVEPGAGGGIVDAVIGQDTQEFGASGARAFEQRERAGSEGVVGADGCGPCNKSLHTFCILPANLRTILGICARPGCGSENDCTSYL